MGVRSSANRKAHVERAPVQSAREILLIIVRFVLWVGLTTAGTVLNMWGAVMLLFLFTPGNLWSYLAVILATALAGCIGGLIIGFGQALALRRWLDGAASLGSFLSTVLASSLALAAGTTAGWWMHTVAGDLGGALLGLVVYGAVFGLIQRPMLDYMSRRSILWVPVNVTASVLGAIAVLSAFDLSGGRRDMLQFRYAGIVYALVVGAAIFWMTRETRKDMDARRTSKGHAISPSGQSLPGHDPGASLHGDQGARRVKFGPEVTEVHEHYVYRVFRVSEHPNAEYNGNSDAQPGPSDRRDTSTKDDRDGPDVIDATYRVVS